MLGHAGVEVTPEALFAALEVRDDEIVLRLELPVEAHLVDAGLLHHGFYANSPHAFVVKQLTRRLEQAGVRVLTADAARRRLGLINGVGGGNGGKCAGSATGSGGHGDTPAGAAGGKPPATPVSFECCLTCYRAVPTIATTLLPT
ncbi:hypothetical protein COLO4_02115, partial [Corchorus olitorius]